MCKCEEGACVGVLDSVCEYVSVDVPAYLWCVCVDVLGWCVDV